MLFSPDAKIMILNTLTLPSPAATGSVYLTLSDVNRTNLNKFPLFDLGYNSVRSKGIEKQQSTEKNKKTKQFFTESSQDHVFSVKATITAVLLCLFVH